MINFIVNAKPCSTNAIWLRSRTGGVIKNTKATEFEYKLMQCFNQEPSFKGIKFEYCKIKIIVNFPEKGKYFFRSDLDNLEKNIFDAIKLLPIIEDDAVILEHTMLKHQNKQGIFFLDIYIEEVKLEAYLDL